MKSQHYPKQVDKLILLCLDGLSWNLLHSFCERGILPNFARLIKNGASGELESLRRLISPRIWATIYTGKDPRKHGVEDFYTLSIKTRQIWEILQENGEKIGVFNPLTAFEARRTNGFIVPGCLAQTVSTYPPDLKFLKELSMEVRCGRLGFLSLVRYAVKLIRHGCRISTLFKAALSYLRLFFSDLSNLDALYKNKEIEALLNSDVFIYCLERYAPTFSVLYDNGIDCVSHFYWKYMEPEFFGHVDEESVKKYGNVIRNYYARIDEIVGRIISVVGNDATFIIVSDHGFEASLASDILVDPLLHYLDLEDKVYGIKGAFFRPKNNEISLQEIEDVLKKVKYKKTRKRVFNVARIYPYVEVSVNTESLLSQEQIVVLPNSFECALENIVNPKPERTGDHAPRGVIIVSGPDILPGESIRNASVRDLVPTILALRKMPLPEDMDGKVLINIFKEPINAKNLGRISSYDSRRIAIEPSVKKRLSKEEEMRIKERLRELGYL